MLVLLNSLFATAILIIIFGAWRYYDIVSNYQNKINSLTSKHLAGIEQSLWLMDTQQTERQLNEIKLILDVDFVEVVTHDNMISSVGESVINPLIQRNLNISRTEGGKLFELGTIHFQLDRTRILKQLFDELIPIIAIALLAVITPVIMNGFSIQKIILIRMDALVNIINLSTNFDINNNLDNFIDKKFPDEIDNLAKVIQNYHQANMSLTTNLQNQQHQLNAIFDNTKLYLGLIDAHGNLLNVNNTSVNVTKYNKEQVLLKPFWGPLWDYYEQSTHDKIKALTLTALKGSIVREEIVLYIDQAIVNLEINFVPIIKNEEVEFVIVEANDLTKIRRWEKQLSIQVDLLKSLVSENALKTSMDLIVDAINPFLPAGVNFHIMEEKGKNKGMNFLSGSLQNKRTSDDFQELIASLLRSEFSIQEPVEIDFNNANILSEEIAIFSESLNFDKLLISPVKIKTKSNQPVFTIITLAKNNSISGFIKQTASMTTSLVELTLAREDQKNLTQIVEDNLSDVIKHSIDGILVFDEKGKILLSNESFDSLVKLPKNKIIGHYFWDLPVDSTEQEIKALFNTTKISRSQFHKFLLSSNPLFKKHCEITLTIIGEKNNEQYYAFIQDRTEQYMLLQELEEQNQFIHAVLDNTSEGIVACDQNAKITVFNRAIQEIYDHEIIDNATQKEIKSLSKDYQLFHTDGTTPLKLVEHPLYSVFSNGKVETQKIIVKPKDKPIRIVNCTGARFYNASGEKLGAVVSIRDITEEYNAQIKLTDYQAHLENLVSKRTEAMATANKELEAFAYSVSHDLKAPLRSINGFAQMLAEDYAEQISENGQDYLSRIRRNATHMGDLIEDMLSLSKISRVNMHSSTIDLSVIAKDILLVLREQYVNLKFAVDENISIYGDSGLTKILLQNLLENAVKYSQHSKEQKIQVSTIEKDKIIWVLITDNGVGFNEKFIDKIFQPFQRLHGDDYEGSGIGLSSVKRVINRHGGEILISSKVNKGTKVMFHYGSFETLQS